MVNWEFTLRLTNEHDIQWANKTKLYTDFFSLYNLALFFGSILQQRSNNRNS